MSSDLYLIARIENMQLSVPCANVIEIVSADRLTPTKPPGLQDPVRGAVQHQDRTLPAVDLRLALGMSSFDQTLAELQAMLDAREQDHVAWLEELRKCCETGDEFTKATDPHKCAFGKWYDALRADEAAMARLCHGDRQTRHIIDQFDEPHKTIHGIAQLTLDLAARGQRQEALDIITQAWDTSLSRMRTLFASLMEAVRSSQRSVYIILDVEGIRFAALVDSAVTMCTLGYEDTHDPSVQSEYVVGVQSTEQYGESLLIDLLLLAERFGARPRNESGLAAAA